MKPGKILLVDDEQIARENLEYILKKEGYEILAVESGLRALEELEKDEFDLVITDLRMPQVDGMQVVERTKQLYPETEVVVITGYATVATAVEAMQKGAYHYLAKPYQNDEVRILIRQAMEKRDLRLLVHELQREVKAQQGFSRAHRQKFQDSRFAGNHLPDCAHGLQCADPGGNRHRERTGGQSHSPSQPTIRQSLYGGQLRGFYRRIAGQRTLRA